MHSTVKSNLSAMLPLNPRAPLIVIAPSTVRFDYDRSEYFVINARRRRKQTASASREKSCLVDPMRLLPVWRTHPAYSEARTRHQALERTHNEARSRANAKARHFETRSKRISRTRRSHAAEHLRRSSPGSRRR